MRPEEDLGDARVTKVVYFDCTEPIDAVRREFPDFEVVGSSVAALGGFSGEMALRGITKAVGIDVVLDRVGIPLSDSIALGDSYNDIEMLEHAGVGIAMANAPDSVKGVADELAETPEEDGLARAFRRHGLLD